MSEIILPARCDRSAAMALLPQLRAASRAEVIGIDGTAVAQIGQAMLQLLVGAKRTGKGAVISASQALQDAARLTGLAEELFGGDGR